MIKLKLMFNYKQRNLLIVYIDRKYTHEILFIYSFTQPNKNLTNSLFFVSLTSEFALLRSSFDKK